MIALCTLIALLPQEPKVATVQVPEPLVVLDASMADVDADGHGDLLLACRDERSGARTLQVHLRQAKGPAFVPTPSRTFPIDGSIVAFAFCDCDPRPGRELVLFGATAAAAVLPTQDGGLDYRELLRHPLVWPAAAPTRLVSLSEQARDLDGDGREDLLLPGPDQWTAWLQQTDGTFVARRLKLPRWRNRISDAVGGGDDGSISLRIPTGGSRGDSSTGTLLRTSARTPPCEVVDLDGDGHPQLVAFRNGAAFALDLRADAVVEDTPLPLPEDRLKLIDPSFDVQWPDVDGDGRRDLMLTTSASRDGEIEARVDLFVAGADGALPARRSSRLRLQPLGQPPQLVDADGDGRLDLVCVSIRTSSLRDFTGDQKTTLDAQLTVFVNDGGQFAVPARINAPLQLDAGSRSMRESFVRVRPGRKGFPGDVLLAIGGKLERRLLAGRGDALRLADADAATDVPEDARIVVADPSGDDVLLVDEREVRHVRFRR